MRTVIRAIGTANPRRYVTQQEFYEWLMHHFRLTPKEHDLYRRVLLDGPIQGRYFGVDYDDQGADLNPDALIDRFNRHGTAMAAQAARDAMHAAGLEPDQIGGLVVNTCTGYLCPGLSSYISEELRLPADAKVFDLMGMGCGGAIPNLEAAAGMLARGVGKPVISIAAEVCSATMFMSPEPDLVISNSIFGDGAAAVVVDDPARTNGQARAQLVDFETGLYPRHREELRYRSQDGRLRNVLSRRVPVLGGRTVSEVVLRLLARHGLSVKDIDVWAVHPGGTQVLNQVAGKLGLEKERLHVSYEIFREYGNMSSPSVLFVLKRTLCHSRPQAGQRGVMVSFGAGFSVFAALLEF